MQELEKILEEMKEIKDGNRKEKLYAKYPPHNEEQKVLNAYSQGYEDGTDNFYNAVVEIIRKHMSSKDSNAPANDGWIPVEVSIPPKAHKTYLVTYQGKNGRRYVKEAYCNHITQSPKDAYWTKKNSGEVIAWRPLLEPYRSEQEAAQRPEWQERMLHTFLGGHA